MLYVKVYNEDDSTDLERGGKSRTMGLRQRFRFRLARPAVRRSGRPYRRRRHLFGGEIGKDLRVLIQDLEDVETDVDLGKGPRP